MVENKTINKQYDDLFLEYSKKRADMELLPMTLDEFNIRIKEGGTGKLSLTGKEFKKRYKLNHDLCKVQNCNDYVRWINYNQYILFNKERYCMFNEEEWKLICSMLAGLCEHCSKRVKWNWDEPHLKLFLTGMRNFQILHNLEVELIRMYPLQSYTRLYNSKWNCCKCPSYTLSAQPVKNCKHTRVAAINRMFSLLVKSNHAWEGIVENYIVPNLIGRSTIDDKIHILPPCPNLPMVLPPCQVIVPILKKGITTGYIRCGVNGCTKH